MGCAQLAFVMEMTSMRNTRMVEMSDMNDGGHGMSYTVLPDATICTEQRTANRPQLMHERLDSTASYNSENHVADPACITSHDESG